jgi:monovalent cation:H+ antiporter-2, CPA2 family
MKLVASEWLQQSLQMTSIARKSINTSKHVIICGYGRCGQNLGTMLDQEGIQYMALDLDPDRVRQAAAAGDSVVFGDAVRLQALMAAGLARASAVVVTYLDTASALKVLANVRAHAPSVPVIVRTVDDHDLEKLQAAGATEVVPEAIEGSLMLASHALALVGVPMRRVIRVVQDQRDARYNLLRGYFRGADDDTADEHDEERLSTVTLPPAIQSAGQTLAFLVLHRLNVRVISLRRRDGKALEPMDDTLLEGGDTLVLSGKPEALALAEDKILRGLNIKKGTA